MQDTCTDHFEPQRFDRVGSRGQGRSKYDAIWGKWGQFWAIFWPYHTPPANLVKSLWFKMVCTCVPHIVLHVLSSTCTPEGYFRPEKSILAKIAIFGCFYGLFLENVPPQLAPYIDSYTHITFLQWLKVIVLVTLKELGCIFSTKVFWGVQLKMSPKYGVKISKSPR